MRRWCESAPTDADDDDVNDCSTSHDELSSDVLVVGAGLVGIATAHYLKVLRPDVDVLLLDAVPPMSRTAAVSGENYRNWWPHPIMTAFTDYSIDLLETLAAEHERVGMTRRGYALAMRSCDVDALLTDLAEGYGDDASLRVHDSATSETYRPAISADWRVAPTGVDVLCHPKLIHAHFPSFDESIDAVVHIRRGGAIDSQQTGQLLLEKYRAAGGRQARGSVHAIESRNGFVVECTEPDIRIHCKRLVNAAGPWIGEIAALLGSQLPVRNVLQQKIAFEDTARAIPRTMPFAIDLDPQRLDWTAAERALLSDDPVLARYVEPMPGAVHCRPEGGDNGTWLKLGWAFTEAESAPCVEPELQPEFPEIVLRGATRLHPSLSTYIDRMPTKLRHYGGYYTMTDENWPLIGATDIEGFTVVGAMSGFGTMAACGGGELAARHVLGLDKPPFAAPLSLARYADTELMASLSDPARRGIL